MDELWFQIGITWPQVLGVVGATTVLYLVYAALLELWTQRLQSSTSTLSLALATVTGAVMARAMLGNSPTLLGGLVALLTLAALESGFGFLRTKGVAKRHRRRRPARVVVRQGRVLRTELRAAHIDEHDLDIRLRMAGVRSYAEVALVILESRGSLTVVRDGQTIDADLVEDVRGIAAVPEEIVLRRQS